MISGAPARMEKKRPGQPTVTLSPSAPVPPILVGGNFDAAIRRAAAYGDGWFPRRSHLTRWPTASRSFANSPPNMDAQHQQSINGWNERAHPFTWTKTAHQILAKTNRKEDLKRGALAPHRWSAG